MKKIILIVFMLIAVSVSARADEKEVPPGMEIIKTGGAEFLVPKGTKVSKTGDLIVFEPVEQYAARKISDMENRLAEFRLDLKEIKEKIEKFSKELVQIHMDIKALKQIQAETSAVREKKKEAAEEKKGAK